MGSQTTKFCHVRPYLEVLEYQPTSEKDAAEISAESFASDEQLVESVACLQTFTRFYHKNRSDA
jgi:hypothetical protein